MTLTVSIPLGEAAPPTPVLELVEVVKQYSGDPPVLALAGVDLRVDQGELINLEIGRKGLAGLFGKYRDDPTLQDICDEAYKERDADVRE